jgi:hypothetical protein
MHAYMGQVAAATQLRSSRCMSGKTFALLDRASTALHSTATTRKDTSTGHQVSPPDQPGPAQLRDSWFQPPNKSLRQQGGCPTVMLTGGLVVVIAQDEQCRTCWHSCMQVQLTAAAHIGTPNTGMCLAVCSNYTSSHTDQVSPSTQLHGVQHVCNVPCLAKPQQTVAAPPVLCITQSSRHHTQPCMAGGLLVSALTACSHMQQ